MGDLAMTIAEEKPSEPSFQALPGKAVGVLVGDAHAVMAREGRKGPDGAVGFARGKGSYRRVYVPASAAGDDCLDIVLKVGMDGKTRKRFPGVELLRQPMLKPQGLDAAFQLVEVEVNEGQGSPASECFVATRITPLDGTKDYPLRVSETIAKLRKEAADQLKARADDIEKALAKQQKDVLGEKKPTGPREESQLTYVTWLPETEKLHVEFRKSITDGLYSYGEGTKKARDFGTVGPKAGRRFGITFGVEVCATYLISKEGTVKDSPLEIRTVRIVTPPPQAASRR